MTGSEYAPRVARVAVDVPLPHLDRVFDYAIPEKFAGSVRPGVRCRVRFAGRVRDGFVLEVADSTDVAGPLAPLERVPSGEVVLTPAVARLLRAVADHWCGTFGDVARLAVPPRHAATEAAVPPDYPAPTVEADARVLGAYPQAEAYLAALRSGRPLRAVWTPAAVAADLGDGLGGVLDAVAAALASGRGALVLVPDAEVLTRLEARCAARFGAGSFATLSADAGPAARYRHFLAAARGHVRLVIGTRAAAYAPVRDLGLVAVWDEGNDLYADPRAPYPHARDVAALRAATEPCALLLAGPGRSAEAEALVARGWAGSLALDPAVARRHAPVVRVAGDHDAALARDPDARAARLPRQVFEAIRVGLASGPVLVQVPRAGYVPALACRGCREPARCPRCSGPLRGAPGAEGLRLACPTCGELPQPWHCPHCGETRLRAPRVGVGRTAEELGKAFGQVKVVQSWSGRVVAAVDAAPQLVLATPGAEPAAASGYAAAVLLDADVLLARPDLRAAEEALRRWLAATALVRPAAEGGTVVIVGDPAARAIQALVRHDPVGFAARELAERAETRFPPAARLVTVEGDADAVASVADEVRLPADAERFGPAPAAEGARLTLRVPAPQGRTLVAAVREVLAARSARKAPPVRVRVDPAALG